MTESEIHVRAPRTPRPEGRPCQPRPFWFRFREDCSRSTAVSTWGKGVDQYVPNLLHMNIILAISRNSDMLFENLKFYSNLVQTLLDLEVARISRARNSRNWPYCTLVPQYTKANLWYLIFWVNCQLPREPILKLAVRLTMCSASVRFFNSWSDRVWGGMQGWVFKLLQTPIEIGGAGRFSCTKREVFDGQKFNYSKFGNKYWNFGAMCLNFGIIYLNLAHKFVKSHLFEGRGGGVGGFPHLRWFRKKCCAHPLPKDTGQSANNVDHF